MAPLAELVGDSPAIASLREEVERFLRRKTRAGRQPSVLIQGETGTGKGLLAHLLHRGGPRRDGPLIEVNCAAIPDALLEAELFGYERGAFTDAHRSKAGLIRAAHGGTLFLDEVGLLALPLQGKLLQVLEAGAVRRLGATRNEPADVWIIAATNEDLAVAVRAGRFRQDLFHRLAVMVLVLPPLRARGDDVTLLAERFLGQSCAEYGLAPKALGPSARTALRAHAWPGNVRELANVIERAVLLSDSAVITADVLDLPASPAGRQRGSSTPLPVPPATDAARRDLEEALARTAWNISRTAARLGLSRNTVRARIRRFGLTREAPSRDAASPLPAAEPVALAPEPAPTPRVAPGAPPAGLRWERRRVALLRVGLDQVGDTTGPLESSCWLEIMIEKVRSFGGQVDAVSPLGIEAVFGIDRTEDPPRRAAHVALAIRRQLSREATPAPPVRMAIHACPVLVVHPGGAGGIEAESKRQIAPLLDALLAAAEPGTIAVSGSAAAFLRRRFILRADGQATPGLGLYRLSGHEELDASGWGHTAALVDREQELALLRVRLDAALGGQGQLVAVLGDPGMGKSRMVWEFVHSDAIRPARVLETGSMYASITPSLAVTELLRRFFDVHPESDVASVRAAVTAQVSGRHPHLGHVVPALLSLLEVADPEWERLEPAERRHRTRQAVTQLLVSESRLQPLVVVVEDVHWMDSESQAVFDMLVGALPSASLLLVVTYRPPFHHEWGDIRHSTLLSLGPLSADAAGELLVGLLGSDPSLEPVTRRLVEYTGGNPFFLEESVQALVETGALEGDRGAYRAPRPLLTFEAPATVEGVLAERIDRLAAESKALIQAAAAIGAETPLALLAAVVDLEPEALQRGLEQLLATELLFESRATRERQLMFKHALIREVAYRSLLPETRRDLHQAIVVAIEAGGAAGAAEQVDRLAHHAYHGELWGAAARYLRQAGDRALRSAALDQASEYFERALEALGRRRDTRDVRHDSVDIRLRLRDALWPQVQLPSILRHLREADALAVALADRRRQGWIACYLSQYFWAAGDLERAHEASDRALALARSLGNQALLAESNVYRGVIQFSLGAFRQAAETFSAGLDLLEEVIAHDAAEFPSPRFVQNGPVILLSFLARSLAELGDFPEALARGREASRRATASGSAFATAAAGGGLGCVFLRKGENARAVEILEPALRVCRTHGFNHWMPTVGGALGAAYVRLGRVEEGRALLQECVDHGDQLGLAASNSLWVIYLGEASLRAGRPAEALALGRRALRLCQERRERGYEAWALHLLALIAALGPTPDVDEASVRYQQALALGQEAAMRPLIAHCHLGLGTLLARTASREAERHLRTAAEGFATLGVVTSDGPLATAWRHAPAVPDGDAPRC